MTIVLLYLIVLMNKLFWFSSGSFEILRLRLYYYG